MATGCALDDFGNLKDASDIAFYDSETDNYPISGSAVPVASSHTLNRQHPGWGAKMAGYIAAETLNSDGEQQKAKRIWMNTGGEEGDDDDKDNDDDFIMGHLDSGSESSDESMDDEVLTNAELASVLLSKTVPMTGCGSGSCKRKHTAPEIVEVEDQDSPHRVASRSPSPVDSTTILEEILASSQVTTSLGTTKVKTDKSTAKNPIYYFYKTVTHGSDGSVGLPRDRHFKCYHGSGKFFMLKKTGKSNLTSMVNNLKVCSPTMFQLFNVLKECPVGQAITEAELDLASGKKVLNQGQAKVYFNNLKTASENICAAFEKQAINAAEPWDQDKFEQLLTEWVVACDQPFEEVDRPEFRELLIYAHHPAPDLKIPHCDAVRRRIMKMGKNSIESMKNMFKTAVPGKISLSLDAWTSSNNYAFLAIVAHYVDVDGNLGL
ncbi:hypothetical protein CVT25_001973 [Psilocybe cyanescens]|uniref:hAT-like transposase RNase-H fold domain-containing protein n=1 Tax=Psilocybe cyanescens TaxID=93625 RepID=A0A409WQR3_PSICY|nr:hypothetical protein CVT25_001973 [Psilocybe cyanescens]